LGGSLSEFEPDASDDSRASGQSSGAVNEAGFGDVAMLVYIFAFSSLENKG
jgi:hypothetical protein